MQERTQHSVKDAASEKKFIKCSFISKKMEKKYTICNCLWQK